MKWIRRVARSWHVNTPPTFVPKLPNGSLLPHLQLQNKHHFTTSGLETYRLFSKHTETFSSPTFNGHGVGVEEDSKVTFIRALVFQGNPVSTRFYKLPRASDESFTPTQEKNRRLSSRIRTLVLHTTLRLPTLLLPFPPLPECHILSAGFSRFSRRCQVSVNAALNLRKRFSK